MADSPEVKKSVVFPENTRKVAEIGDKIMAFAVADSVRTIRDEYSDYDGVLYWKFNATENQAQSLRVALGADK